MSNDIFISYSRRDLEFVTRLASDLDEKVAGVWFDKADIQPGQKWRDEIINGIQRCKAVVLVLSPDAAGSKYVQMEINTALESGKTIIPILYRPVTLEGGLKDLVHETQYIDLQRGTYGENFQVLVDGLVAAGAARQSVAAASRPFLRTQTPTDWGAVLTRIPGWGCAWSLGWAAFWLVFILALALLGFASGNDSDVQSAFWSILAMSLSGGAGGFAGGLLAGLVTMLTLRRYAPSIALKHMAPSVRIWVASGLLGVVVSGLGTALLMAVGALTVAASEVDCSNLSLGDCFGASLGSTLGAAIGTLILVLVVFLGLMGLVWFAAGLFAGWLAVRHIRTLEPGITPGETRWVMFGWGLGAVAATVVALAAIALSSSILGV